MNSLPANGSTLLVFSDFSEDASGSLSNVRRGQVSNNVRVAEMLNTRKSWHFDGNLSFHDSDLGPSGSNSSGTFPGGSLRDSLACALTLRHQVYFFVEGV